MKKIISLILSICMVITGLPMVVYAASSTPEISFEKFSAQLQEIQAEYDDYCFSEITIENDSESYYVDGEENILTDTTDDVVEAVVSSDNFEFPFSAIADYCELPETSIYSLNDENFEDITVDKETAEALGFEVDIEDDKAVLTQPYQTERLIVKSKYAINPLDSVAIVEGYNDLHIVQFDNQESAIQAEKYYNNQKLIEYAEPDLVISTMDIDYTVEASAVTSSSITYDNHLSWGSESIGVDDYIDYLGEISELPEIVVGIIDTGVDIDHEFLKNRIIETGFNLSDSGTANSEDDDNGHGSHVAGIVADNTTDNIKIKAFKCLDKNGSGDLSNVVLAIDAAVENGVNVINMSLGARASSSTMKETIENAVNNGITVCVSAGNSGRDASKYTPANIESCITIAAIDAYDQQPYWTNYGDVVDIVAPGVSIYSTYKNNSYATLSGTSMASPFVAAASALILSKNNSFTANEICDILTNSGRIWYKESDANYIDSLHGKKALYIGTVNDFNNGRTSIPKLSIESGRYSDSITIEITCEDKDTEIYYTLDGSRASQETGIPYTESIVIDKVTVLHAVAYAPSKMRSLQVVANYYIVTTDPNENFLIDSEGVIIEYLGSNDYLNVPETIAGITVRGIGSEVFRKSSIAMIILPDTVKSIGDYAFYNCNNLYSVYCKNLTDVGNYTFYSCNELYSFTCNSLNNVGKCGFRSCGKLTNIDLSNLKAVDTYGFYKDEQITQLSNEYLTEINVRAFEYCEGLIYINLPNVTIANNCAFKGCSNLEYVNMPNLETLEPNAMEDLYSLEELELPNLTTLSGTGESGRHFANSVSLKQINLPKLEGNIPAYAFSNTALECISFDKVISVGRYAFEYSKIKTINLENVTDLSEGAFAYCYHLEDLCLKNATYISEKAFAYSEKLKNIYIPKVTKINDQAFYRAKIVGTIFAPSLEAAVSLPNCDDVTIYLSDSSTQLPATSGNYTYNIIAPSGSYAEQWAKDNNHTFIPSDYRDNNIDSPLNVTDLGRSICTSVAGVRFGFTWDNIDEIESLASDIEYGFIYSQKGDENLSIDTVDNKNIKKAVANNRVDHGDTTSFNLVISNIPTNYYDREITARAYVCIDGMYFYSNVLKGSFSEVANLVLADDEIDQATKDRVQNLLSKEV